MKILGISALYHDSSAALCIDGEVVAAVQEERFTRKKHDSSFPVNAIDYCLESLQPTDKLDAVVFYDNPLLTLDRWISNIVELGEDSKAMIDKSFDTIFKSKLWIHKIINDKLGYRLINKEILVVKHHISHAASAFFLSPYKNAAILTIDGVGEWTTTALGFGINSEITLIKEIRYPDSLGLLYSSFTYFCGFKVNSGDYKLMGLAAYGEPKYYDLIKDKLIDINPDGSYRLNMEYFDFHRNNVMINNNFATLFNGPPRQQETMITKREMDIAASIQKVLDEVVLLLVKHLKNITGEKNLVMAGGVALNCVTNGKIYKERIFDNIWIQPAAGDAGGALGAALYANYVHFKQPRILNNNGRDKQKGNFLGPSFTNSQIMDYLNSVGAVYEFFDDKKELYRNAAKYIANGAVLGFFNGRMEFGPRSLGGRSILADPRDANTQSKLNLKTKHRESFRPFAPSVLAERVAEYFDLDIESPYMLLASNVKNDLLKNCNNNISSSGEHVDMLLIINQERSVIPAVTHVDYSARIQTVNKLDNEDYYNLLVEFEKLTGCAVLVNTSFNIRGEPIVCTPSDAYRCFMHTEIDVLIMENILLFKYNQTQSIFATDRRVKYELD